MLQLPILIIDYMANFLDAASASISTSTCSYLDRKVIIRHLFNADSKVKLPNRILFHRRFSQLVSLNYECLEYVYVADIIHLKKLKKLKFDQTPAFQTGDASVDDLDEDKSNLNKLTQLEYLDIPYSSYIDKLVNLKTLIAGEDVTQDAIKNLTKLEHITLDGNTNITDLNHLKNLKTLIVNEPSILTIDRIKDLDFSQMTKIVVPDKLVVEIKKLIKDKYNVSL